jgi:hypothetical protein
MKTITDERAGQYMLRCNAVIAARLETMRTGIKHMVREGTTWRDMVPMKCWTIVKGK